MLKRRKQINDPRTIEQTPTETATDQCVVVPTGETHQRPATGTDHATADGSEWPFSDDWPF